jgi:hypothetical protein
MPRQRMTKDEAKAAEERAVFRDFAAAARLRIVPESVQSRPPPEPDILCAFQDGSCVAFELVRLVDQDLAHGVTQTIANPDDPKGVWFDDPTLERIQEKLTRKNYRSPHPMELLAWGDDTLLPQSTWVPKFAGDLRALFDASRSPFQRLWVVNLGRLAASDPVWLVHPDAPAP